MAYRKTFKYWWNGQEIDLLTISALANIIKCSVETIRYWERKEVIPKPMFRIKGVRLYHPKEAAAMKSVLKKVRSPKNANNKVLKELMWVKLAEVRQELVNAEKSE